MSPYRQHKKAPMTLEELWRTADRRRFRAKHKPTRRVYDCVGPGPEPGLYIVWTDGDKTASYYPADARDWELMVLYKT